MFAPRRGLSFIFDLPSSIHAWKIQFFFVSSTLSWNFSFIWETPNTSPNDNNQVNPTNRKDFLKLKDMKVPMQKELLTDQTLYDAGLGPAPTVVMHPSSSLSAADIRQLMGKQKLSAIGKAIVALTVSAPTQDMPVPILAEDMSARAALAVEDTDDDVVIIEPPAALAEPAISRVPSMPDVGSQEHQPTVPSILPTFEWMSNPFEQLVARQQRKAPASSAISGTPTGLKSINIHVPLEESALTNPTLAKWLVDAILLLANKKSWRSWTLNDIFSSFYTLLIGAMHDMSELDRFMHNFTEIYQGWKDMAMAAVMEKNAIL
ncbi:hypothetical protein COCNU_13G002580 [Cocos nucifera]|uniref:Uncharacterized protein n=1 Tax=Cocos nucifera TaxID=13894 RepID=A0A8K0NBA1_COCNU|nr:hypothetical protein COCNU_13G002580 [Cocos nucifera]